MKKILCRDWGGTFMKYALMDEEGKILSSSKVKSPGKGDSKEVLLSCLDKIVYSFEDIDGIAISSAGVIDSKNGVIEAIGIFPYLNGCAVCEELQERYKVKVTIENDARCALGAEVWKGNLQDVQDGAVVVIGTGIGTALFLDGKVRGGVHHLAGEMCAACIDVKEKKDRMSYIGQRGTPYLCKLVSETCGRKVHNGEEVFHLIEEGNEKALQGLQAYTDDLALIIFNMFVLLDLEKVCIGGGISCQPVLMECLEKSIQNIATFHPDIVQGTQYPLPEVDVCRYFNDANLLGALYTFLKTW